MAAGDLFLAHVTIHADANRLVDGTADGWTEVAEVDVGDLSNTVLSKIATGSEGATASIDWHGENSSIGEGPPSFVIPGAGASGSDPAVNLSVPYPSGMEANDLILLHVGIRAGSGTSVATPAGFAALHTPDVSTSSTSRIFSKFATGSETGTLSVDWGASSSVTAVARMYAFRGVVVTTAPDFIEGGGTANSGGTASALITIPSVTTTAANRLAVAFPTAVAVRTFDVATGEIGGDYTEPVAEYGAAPIGSGYTIGLQVAPMPAAGTISGGTILLPSSGGGAINWHCRSFALEPAEGSGEVIGQRVAAATIYRLPGPDVTIKAIATTQGTGTTVTFPSVTLGAGDTGIAFLSVNGAATQTGNPTSTWAFNAGSSSAAGDDIGWARYDAGSSPTNGTLTINAGDRWSVIAFAVGPAPGPEPDPVVITRRQIKEADIGSVTLDSVPVSGNLLIAESYHRGTGSNASISGTGWTQRILRTEDLADANLQQGLAVWTKVAGAGEPTTITVTWTPASTNRVMVQEMQANQAVTWTFRGSASNST